MFRNIELLKGKPDIKTEIDPKQMKMFFHN